MEALKPGEFTCEKDAGRLALMVPLKVKEEVAFWSFAIVASYWLLVFVDDVAGPDDTAVLGVCETTVEISMLAVKSGS